MSQVPSSTRSSDITDLIDDPATPTPSGRSGVPSEPPYAPDPERSHRLNNESLTQQVEADPLQTLILQMQTQIDMQTQTQNEMQDRILQHQRDFEARMQTLLLGNTKNSPQQGPPSVFQATLQPPNDSTPAVGNQHQSQVPVDHNHASPASGVGEAFSPESKQPYASRQPTFPYAYPYQGSAATQIAKVKAADLPKFKGTDDEDIELWIQQLAAIFEANRVSNAEILGHISVTLKDNASLWYAKLGSDVRSSLATWDDWKNALRQRFQKANYNTDKKREWKKRDLKVHEKMSTYFDDKVYLQSFVFDRSTSDRERIEDLLDGLPKYMVPILKGSIRFNTDLLEFRRILLDYEDGLRPAGVWNARLKTNVSTIPEAQNIQTISVRDSSKPPRACSCGEMHWYKDCPKRSCRTNIARPFPSPPNRIAITNSKWPRPTSSRSEQQLIVTSPSHSAEAHINLASIENGEHPVASPECLPEQDNEGYADLYQTLCNHTAVISTKEPLLPIAPDSLQILSPGSGWPDIMSNNENPSKLTSTQVYRHNHDDLDTLRTMSVDVAEGHSGSSAALYADIATRDEKDSLETDFRKTNEVFKVDHNPILICETDLFWEMVDTSGGPSGSNV